VNRFRALLASCALAAVLGVAFFASAQAANVHTGPSATGNGSGSDWNNIANFNTLSLLRGNTYYLQDGSYSGKTFNTANSGTTLITIKKAIESDHGSATGWQTTYGDGQAVFGAWQVHTDYWVFDGQRRNSNWQGGAINQYGIRVAAEGPLRLDNGAGAGADNTTFRYIDIEAGGRGTGFGDDVVYGLASNSNITFQYCALHDSDRTIFLMRGAWQNLLVEYCYIARNNSTPANHGEMLSDVESDFLVFRYNVIFDIFGTGVWAVLNGGGSKSPSNTANGWKIYGNLIHWPSGGGNGVAAVFYSANDATNSNWTDNLQFYNNTIIAFGNGPLFFGIHIEAGSGNVVKNNIWYDPEGLGQGGATFTHNSYHGVASDGGPNSQVLSGDPFVNRIGGNFHLSGTNLPSAGDATIGAEYNMDMDGVTRGADGTWDRGAFEFQAGARPSPPSNVRITSP